MPKQSKIKGKCVYVCNQQLSWYGHYGSSEGCRFLRYVSMEYILASRLHASVVMQYNSILCIFLLEPNLVSNPRPIGSFLLVF